MGQGVDDANSPSRRPFDIDQIGYNALRKVKNQLVRVRQISPGHPDLILKGETVDRSTQNRRVTDDRTFVCGLSAFKGATNGSIVR